MPTTRWCGWNHRRENAFPQTIIHSIIHKKTASPLPVPPPAQTELLRGFPPRQPKTLRDGGPGAETFLRKTSSPGSLLRSISSGGQEGSFRGRWNSPATRAAAYWPQAGNSRTRSALHAAKDAFLSQHVGDLKNLETFEFFQNMAEHLGGLLEVKPEAIVCDLHPDYLSTGYALDSGLPSCACNTTSPMCTAYWRKTGMTPPRSGWRWTAPGIRHGRNHMGRRTPLRRSQIR